MAKPRSQIHSIEPDAFVQFWCYEKEELIDPVSRKPIALNSSILKVSDVMVRKDIRSIQTTKSKTSSGTFRITLSPSANWKSIIPAGSWCFIHMSDSRLLGGEGTEPSGGLKMIGIVKAVRYQESVHPETGSKSSRYIVSGEDFHSLFNSKVFLAPQITQGQEKSTLTSLVVLDKLFLDSINKTPDVIVNNLIDAIIGEASFDVGIKGKDGKVSSASALSVFKAGYPIQVPTEVFKKVLGTNGTTFSKMFARFIWKPLLGRISSFVPSFSDQTELWSAIQTYSNQILNECYTELLPINVNGKTRLLPSFIMRPIPFSIKPPAGTETSTIKYLASLQKTKPLNPQIMGREEAAKQRAKQESSVPKLEGRHFYISRQIFEDEIMDLDAGKSDSERINFFFVTSTIAGAVDSQAQVLNAGGLENMINMPSAVRHGLRPLIYTSMYDTLREGDTSFSLMTKVVRDMWETAHLFDNGFCTIVGTPVHIPVGTNVMFSERGWIAHVESVTNNFMVSPDSIKRYTTTIAFSRLMKTNGKPVDQVESKQVDGQLGRWDRGVVDVPSITPGGKLRRRPK